MFEVDVKNVTEEEEQDQLGFGVLMDSATTTGKFSHSF